MLITRVACGYRMHIAWAPRATFTPADLAWFRSPIREVRP